MVTKQVVLFADMLVEKELWKEDDRDILIFGMTTGLHWLLNIVTMVVLGILFDLVVESLVFLISFSCIRIYAGGFHCKKAGNCYFFSSGIVAFVLAMVRFTSREYTPVISFLLLLFSVPIRVKLTSVETPTKLLDEVEINYFRKKTLLNLSIECITLMLLYAFQWYEFSYTISLGILVSAAFVVFHPTLTKKWR